MYGDRAIEGLGDYITSELSKWYLITQRNFLFILIFLVVKHQN